MINWIVAFFFFLEEFGFLRIEDILTKNLPMLLICRFFYCLTYVLNYYKSRSSIADDNNSLFIWKETIYFILKQLILILFGTLYLPFAVFISFYSLMMSGKYIETFAKNKKNKYLAFVGKLVNVIVPLLGILWYTFVSLDYYSIAAIGISIAAFLHYGLKISSLSAEKLLKKYQRRYILKVPKILQYILLVFLIAFPSTVIIGTGVYKVQEKQTFMGCLFCSWILWSPTSCDFNKNSLW